MSVIFLKLRHINFVVFSLLRGFFVRILYLPSGNGKGLRLGRNTFLRGNICIGQDVVIGSNVKLFHNCFIGNNCLVDNNVEFRSSKNFNIEIGNGTSINRNCVIIGKVSIGSNVSIAPNCVVVGSNHSFEDIKFPIKKQPIVIKGLQIFDNVWIGANVSILDGVTIGEGSVIGAGSVVTKSIPPNSIAFGIPCRISKRRDL